MSAEGKLREIATKIASRHSERVIELEKKIRELEARKVDLQAKLDAASRINDRLTNYEVMIGRKYGCPRCAIERGKQVPLSTFPIGEKVADKLKCPVCGLDIALTA